MKRFVLWTLAVLTITAGCEIAEPLPDVPSSGEEAYVSVKLQMSSGPALTRAGQEDAIWDGIILEFDPDGGLLERMYFSGNTPPALQVRKYQQTDIYIVANPTVNLWGVSTKQEFLAAQSEYKSNSSGKLEMTGSFSGKFNADTTVHVLLNRTVAKICVDAIVFKIASTVYDYTGINMSRGYMEKTPATCGYDLSLSDSFVDAYEQRIGIGYVSGYTSSPRHYTQGEYKVWEYNYPWEVYCYPNEASDSGQRNKLAISYRLNYKFSGIDNFTGEPIVLYRYEDACVHLVLPPMRPNTVYELEKLTLVGARYKTVLLGTRSGQEESLTCSFRMTDMTSGEYLGTVEGEVEYEEQDS